MLRSLSKIECGSSPDEGPPVGVVMSHVGVDLLPAPGTDHLINNSPRNGETGVQKFRDDVNAFTGGRREEFVFDTVGGEVALSVIVA